MKQKSVVTNTRTRVNHRQRLGGRYKHECRIVEIRIKAKQAISKQSRETKKRSSVKFEIKPNTLVKRLCCV